LFLISADADLFELYKNGKTELLLDDNEQNNNLFELYGDNTNLFIENPPYSTYILPENISQFKEDYSTLYIRNVNAYALGINRSEYPTVFT